MIFFFGTRSRTIFAKPIQDLTCPRCGHDDHKTFGILRYFHVCWIPVLPLKKMAATECMNCQQVQFDKTLPASLAKRIADAAFGRRNMLPMYSGLILITCLLVTGFSAANNDARKEQTYIASPKVHDYYVVDLTRIFKNTDPDFKYAVMRVISVSDNQLEMEISKYAYNKPSGPNRDIRYGQSRQSAYYTGSSFRLDLTRIKKLQDSGAIYSIERS